MYKRLQELKTNESVFLFGPRRCGKSTLLVEIKSGQKVPLNELSNLIGIAREMKNAEAICLYNGAEPMKYDGVEVLQWRSGIVERIFAGV